MFSVWVEADIRVFRCEVYCKVQGRRFQSVLKTVGCVRPSNCSRQLKSSEINHPGEESESVGGDCERLNNRHLMIRNGLDTYLLHSVWAYLFGTPTILVSGLAPRWKQLEPKISVESDGNNGLGKPQASRHVIGAICFRWLGRRYFGLFFGVALTNIPRFTIFRGSHYQKFTESER